MNENGGVDECVSLSRAAEILGFCVRTVRREIERRKLIAFHGLVLLAVGDQSFSPSESASVGESPEVADGARCRVRTCDFLRVKQALYH